MNDETQPIVISIGYPQNARRNGWPYEIAHAYSWSDRDMGARFINKTPECKQSKRTNIGVICSL